MIILRGLYIGRFQPPHKGHVKAVNHILDEVDCLIIGIGSAQSSHSKKNPFQAGERNEMLLKALYDDKVDGSKFMINPLPDINFNSIWVNYVEAMTPEFEVVYTGNSLVSRLFEEAGYEVHHLPMFEKNDYSSTIIRNKILEEEDWEDLVPDPVAEYVKKIDGVERLNRIDSDLEDPMKIPEM